MTLTQTLAIPSEVLEALHLPYRDHVSALAARQRGDVETLEAATGMTVQELAAFRSPKIDRSLIGSAIVADEETDIGQEWHRIAAGIAMDSGLLDDDIFASRSHELRVETMSDSQYERYAYRQAIKAGNADPQAWINENVHSIR